MTDFENGEMQKQGKLGDASLRDGHLAATELGGQQG